MAASQQSTGCRGVSSGIWGPGLGRAGVGREEDLCAEAAREQGWCREAAGGVRGAWRWSGSGGPVPPRSPGVPGLKKPVLAQGLGRHAGDCKGLSCGGAAPAGPLLRV